MVSLKGTGRRGRRLSLIRPIALEAGIDTNSALIVEKGKDLYVEYLVARPGTELAARARVHSEPLQRPDRAGVLSAVS